MKSGDRKFVSFKNNITFTYNKNIYYYKELMHYSFNKKHITF